MAVGGMVLVLAALAAGSAQAPIAFSRQALVANAEVDLGDIADLRAVPAALCGRAAKLPIALFAPGRAAISFSAGRAAERARALMPALAPWLDISDRRTVTVRRAVPPPAAGRTSACARVQAPVAALAFVTAADLAPSPCTASAGTVLRYDRATRSLRAARELRVGDTIEAPQAFALAELPPGTKLWIEARSGPVAVRRQVEVVQPASAGRALFVRAADGEVFTAPHPEPGK